MEISKSEPKPESTTGNVVQNPELYFKLAEDLPLEEAEKKGKEFYEEVCKLREKYHIPEMVIAYGINVKDTEDKKCFMVRVGYRGGLRTDRLVFELVTKTRLGDALLNLIDEITVNLLT
jgi:hypothetical protein